MAYQRANRLKHFLFLASIAAGVTGPSDRLRMDISLFEIDETPPHLTRRNTLSLWLMVGAG